MIKEDNEKNKADHTVKHRILVVDDEAGICRLMENFFRGEGFEVDSAQDGTGAKSLCAESVYDLAFIDIMLPDMKGDALFGELRSLGPGLECIIFTGHASLESAIDAVKQPGVVAYELKPLDLEAILKIVNEVMARKRVEAALRNYRERLEIMIEERTRELTEANRLLRSEIAERKRYEQELKRSESRLNKLTNSLIQLQEKERSRIAGELHDELGQKLSFMLVELEYLRKSTPGGDAAIDNLVKTIEDTSRGVSRIYRGLHPALLHKLGLTSAIRTFIDEFGRHESMSVDAQMDDIGKGDLPPDVSLNIYRIFQEAMTNAARHSGAGSLRVSFKVTGDMIKLTISDDGKGFSSIEAETGEGVGLAGMKQRAAICGGELIVESEPGRGTDILLNIPAPNR